MIVTHTIKILKPFSRLCVAGGEIVSERCRIVTDNICGSIPEKIEGLRDVCRINVCEMLPFCIINLQTIHFCMIVFRICLGHAQCLRLVLVREFFVADL